MPPKKDIVYTPCVRTVFNVHGAQMSVSFPGMRGGGKSQDPKIERFDMKVATYDGAVYGPPTQGAIGKQQVVLDVLRRGWQEGNVYTCPLVAGEECWALIACLGIEAGKPSRFVAVSRSVEIELRAAVAAYIEKGKTGPCAFPHKALRKHFLSWGCGTKTSVGRAGPDPMMCISWSEMLFNKNNPSVWTSFGAWCCHKQRHCLHLVCADDKPVNMVMKGPTDKLAPHFVCDTTTIVDPKFPFVRGSFPGMTREERAVCYLTAPDNYCGVERQWMRDAREKGVAALLGPRTGAAPLAPLALPGSTAALVVRAGAAAAAGAEAAALAPLSLTGVASAAVPGAREDVTNEPMCWHDKPAPPTLKRFCERCKAVSAAAEIGSLAGRKRAIVDVEAFASEQIARMASLLDVCAMAVRMPV